MKKAFQSSRDVIIQTDNWAKAIEFYETTMGFTVSHRSSNLMGFETGAFCLYVEKGNRPGPVFDFLVPDMRAAKSRLLAAGCTGGRREPRDSALLHPRSCTALFLTSKKKAILLRWI